MGNQAGGHLAAGGHAAPHRRLFRLIRPEASDIWIIVLLSALNGILMLAPPLAVDAVVNTIAFGGEERVYLQALAVVSAVLLLALLLMAGMRAAQHYVMELVQRRLFVRMTADLAYRLPHADMASLERTQGPELVNRFFEVVTIQKSSALLLLEGVNLVLATLIGLVVLAFYHPFLLAFDLVLMVCLALVIFVAGRSAVKTSIAESYAKHAVAGWLEQMAMHPLLFKGDGAGELACRRAEALASEYLAARGSHFRVLLRQICGLLGLQALASAALLTVGGFLVLRGELTLGQLVASELIVGAIVSSVSKFGKHLEAWYDALAAVDKLGYLVDLPTERESGEKVEGTSPMDVRIESVSFGYTSDREVLSDFSALFPAGARVALVGAAGQGATTLLDLMYGLRTASRGAIALGGVDLRHWNLRGLRSAVALVNGRQLVTGTIFENVQMGRSDVSAGEVRWALESVGLMEFLMHFPEGLETRLSAGGRPLSSTQQLLLVLARAVAGRPRLLLIDECLDGLDADALAVVEKVLFDEGRPWTLVLVTRDGELMRRCDLVVRLGKGQVNETGAWREKEGA